MHLKGVSVQTLPDGCQRLTVEVLIDGKVVPEVVTRTFNRGMSLADASGRIHQIAYELTAKEVRSSGRD